MLSTVSSLESQEPGDKGTGEAATLLTEEVVPQKSLADCGNAPGTDAAIATPRSHPPGSPCSPSLTCSQPLQGQS